MKKHILEMKFSEMPRWIIVVIYAIFVSLFIEFLLPVCNFSYVCLSMFIISSTALMVTLISFPYQNTRTR
jgi:hypothetical protein